LTIVKILSIVNNEHLFDAPLIGEDVLYAEWFAPSLLDTF
jgi:hypothetical protein